MVSKKLTAIIESSNVTGLAGVSSLIGTPSVSQVCGVVNSTISGVGIYVPYIGALKDVNLGNFDLYCDVLHYNTLDPGIDLSDYVPYTGTAQNVNLGSYDLLANNITANGLIMGGSALIGDVTSYTQFLSTGKLKMVKDARVKKKRNVGVNEYFSRTANIENYGLCDMWTFDPATDSLIDAHISLPWDVDMSEYPAILIEYTSSDVGAAMVRLEILGYGKGVDVTSPPRLYEITKSLPVTEKNLKHGNIFEITEYLPKDGAIMIQISRIGTDKKDSLKAPFYIMNTDFIYTSDVLGR